MARLRNVNSGALVEVDDETAGRLGSEWEPVKDDTKPAAAKKAAGSRKKSDD